MNAWRAALNSESDARTRLGVGWSFVFVVVNDSNETRRVDEWASGQTGGGNGRHAVHSWTVAELPPREREQRMALLWPVVRAEEDDRRAAIISRRHLDSTLHHHLLTTTPSDQPFKMVVLETSDQERFTVDKDVAERSLLIKQMLDGE